LVLLKLGAFETRRERNRIGCALSHITFAD